MEREKRIWDGLNDHYKEALEYFPENCIVGLFLQGSQNYNLDFEDSDIDTKLIVTPPFKSLVFNEKPVSTTHHRANDEHIDFKDIRLYIDCFRKQNLNFLEILFTDYFIINPLYKDSWDILVSHREEIAHMNPHRSMRSMAGMCGEKNHALQHPYPAKLEILAKHGYDGKQLSHQERVRHAMIKYAAGDSYWSCIHEPFEPEYLKMMKRHGLKVEEAVALSKWSLQQSDAFCEEFCAQHPKEENEDTLKLLREVQRQIMEISVREELPV